MVTNVYALAGVLGSTFALGDQQQSKLRAALRELYERYQIPFSPRLAVEEVSTWPEFSELQEVVAGGKGTNELMGRIEVLFDTGIFSGKAGTMGKLLSSTSILSLKDLPFARKFRMLCQPFCLEGFTQHSHLWGK